MSSLRPFFLGLALCATASTAAANAPQTSLRPQAREAAPVVTPAAPAVTETRTASAPPPSDLRPRARATLADIVAGSGVTGNVSFALADVASGEIIAEVNGERALPPASVAKAVTALYALETLGGDFRFPTRVLATGPVENGVLDGDLILAGGGFPNLLTDDLAELAGQVAATGITRITGEFQVWGEALPRVAEIDEEQMDHLGYNPSVGGLNLNFNRVHFGWQRAGTGYTVTMDARSETRRPPVSIVDMRVVDRMLPVYTYRDANGRDSWTVAKGQLNGDGSRWLPVRYPALYTADVFRALMDEEGVTLPQVVKIDTLPEGRELARFDSETLTELMQSTLRFSTNISAEAAGMAATHAITGGGFDLDASAAYMNIFTDERAGIAPYFEDHSGLGDDSRISAVDMVTLLNAPGAVETLRPILKIIPFRDTAGNPVALPAQVRAKTGTLNFVSGLAGYLTTDRGRTLSFAIFAADFDKRERGIASGDERPRGSISYNTAAKRLQQDLLQYVARIADAPEMLEQAAAD